MDKFLIEQSKILKAFFKNNERLRKIVGYDDQMDLPTLILMLRRKKAKLPGRHLEIPSIVFESRMQDEVQAIKNEIYALRLKLKANVKKEKEKEITVPTEKKYGYNELLISMLVNADPSFKLFKDSISKAPYLKIRFDKVKAYEHFFTILKEQYSIKAILEQPLQFDGDYLITDLSEKSLRNLKNSFAKKNNKLIRYKNLIGNKMGLKIDFQEALMDLWAEFLRSQEKEAVKKRKQPILRTILSRKEVKAIIGVVGITALIVMIIWGIVLISRPTIIIEHGDDVKIYYQAWELDEDENYNPLSPIIDENVWVEMIPRTENSSGLMLGLYSNLLGKEVNYESGLIWLNRCIDEDLDGLDDNTGQPALSFGKSSDIYFDTCLMIQFKVLSIQKN